MRNTSSDQLRGWRTDPLGSRPRRARPRGAPSGPPAAASSRACAAPPRPRPGARRAVRPPGRDREKTRRASRPGAAPAKPAVATTAGVCSDQARYGSTKRKLPTSADSRVARIPGRGPRAADQGHAGEEAQEGGDGRLGEQQGLQDGPEDHGGRRARVGERAESRGGRKNGDSDRSHTLPGRWC